MPATENRAARNHIFGCAMRPKGILDTSVQ